MAGSRAGEAPTRPIGAGVAPVRYRGRTLWLVWRPERTGGRILRPRHLDAARALLRELLLDDRNGAPIQRVLREATPGSASTVASNEADLDHAARLMESGRLALVEPAAPEEKSQGHTVPVSTPAPEEEAAAPAAKPKTKTYFKMRVILDSSGRAVPGVRLRVTTPDGIENFHTTNSAGEIEIREIDRGECEVRSELAGVAPDNTLHLVKVSQDDKPADPGSSETPPPASLRLMADVETHKVKTGESILSLAKGAGLKWQDLAKFNWGTDVPEKINEHLRDEVGCTKKTKDGYNYMFDDSDDPGLMLIPRKAERTGLATGSTHVFRVTPLGRSAAVHLIIPLEMDPTDDPDQDDELKIDNGSFAKALKATDSKVRREEKSHLLFFDFGVVPDGEYTVTATFKGTPSAILHGLMIGDGGVTVNGRAFDQVDLTDLNLGDWGEEEPEDLPAPQPGPEEALFDEDPTALEGEGTPP